MISKHSIFSLFHLARRYIFRHAWQSGLMILGIALGVAVMVSIDLANTSAGRAFELSSESITGKATHQILPSGGPLNDKVYVAIKRSDLEVKASPVISAYVTLPKLDSHPLTLLGFDPLIDNEFQLLSNTPIDQMSLLHLFSQPGAVLISRDLAAQLGVGTGDHLDLDFEGRPRDIVIVGILTSEDALTRRTLSGMLLADISIVQELTDRNGQLDRIDLILPKSAEQTIEKIKTILPDGVELQASAIRQGSVAEMMQAFQLNLTALSLLALIVGIFLIYNTITFSVVQRRELIGTLRCLGVTRGEIFVLIIGEAFIVGVVGSLIGVGLGVVLGRNTVNLVSQTINDLYYTTTVREVGLPLSSLIKGGLLGVLSSVLAAIPPSFEAAATQPKLALSRSDLETATKRKIHWITAAGILLIAFGYLVFRIPSTHIEVGFLGTFLTVIGIAFIASTIFRIILVLIMPITSSIFGWIGRMVPRTLLNSLSRTAVAVAALMIAFAVATGVTIMIDSFRHTVIVWLEQTLQSDVYISGQSFTANTSQTPIDPVVLPMLGTFPGVKRVDVQRSTTVQSNFGDVALSATNNGNLISEREFKNRIGTNDELKTAFGDGAILISEPLSNRLKIKLGDDVLFNTPNGSKVSKVIGIYYDYASSAGTVMIDLPIYRKWWQDDSVTAIGLRLTAGTDADKITSDLQKEIPKITEQHLIVRPNQALRKDVMEIFDRTFAITSAMRILATLVALIGILSTLLLLQMEKQREVGILKALGLGKGDLWKMVMLETGIMGLSAGILAAPTGYILALILIKVINLRSFGWTLQLSVNSNSILFTIGLAVIAALLVGIIPAVRLSRMAAAEVIRNE